MCRRWEAPDAETITALGLSVGKLGNVRTGTPPAFDNAGMEAILKRLPSVCPFSRWDRVRRISRHALRQWRAPGSLSSL